MNDRELLELAARYSPDTKIDMEPVAWADMESDEWLFVSGSTDPNHCLIGSFSPLYSSTQLDTLQAENERLLDENAKLSEQLDISVKDCAGALLQHVTAERDALQAKVDALMLEYCPDEMTPEQLYEWEEHQFLAKHEGEKHGRN